MLRPPALKAIVPVDATDDVYTDDIIYWNGALQFESLGRWPFSMIAPNGRPFTEASIVDRLFAVVDEYAAESRTTSARSVVRMDTCEPSHSRRRS